MFVAPIENVKTLDISAIRSANTVQAVFIALLGEYGQYDENSKLLRALLLALDILGPHVVRAFRTRQAVLSEGSCLNISGPSLLLYDDFLNPFQYDEVPLVEWNKTSALKRYFEKRYGMTRIEFQSFTSSYDIRWAHARGNIRLVKLGQDGSNLLVSVGKPAIQYTTPGHMFFVIALGASHKELPDKDDMISFFLVPASKSPFPPVNISPIMPENVSHRDAFELSPSFAPRQCITAASHSFCREMLLQYWQTRRQSHIWTQSWVLKSLKSTRTEINEKSWHSFRLPSPLHDAVVKNYLSTRKNGSKPEPLISTVFNQFDSMTYYIPVENSLLDKLSDIIIEESSKWFSLPEDSLVVTGSYGVREYRKGAVINWHTDPAEFQPITAIIHICNDKCVVEKGQAAFNCFSDWKFQIAGVKDQTFLGEERPVVDVVDMAPGDVILIESARLPHARPHPLKSSWYGNVFVHLAPKDWSSYMNTI